MNIGTIFKSKYDGLTPISAAEFDGLTEILRGNVSPAILSKSAALAVITASGTPLHVLTVSNFSVAGDAIVTGGALCSAFYSRTLDFLTSGPAGGALPSGTYKAYLRIQEAGAGARSMQCWLCVTKESETFDVDSDEDSEAKFIGTIDETRYLVIRTGIVWDAGTSTITNLGADARAGKYGTLDLSRLGRGDIDEIVIGDADRDVRLSGHLTAAGGLRVASGFSLVIGDSGDEVVSLSNVGGASDYIRGLFGEGFYSFSGPPVDVGGIVATLHFAKGNIILGDDGTGVLDLGVKIDLGDWSCLFLGANSAIQIDAGTTLNATFKKGAAVTFADGTGGGDLGVVMDLGEYSRLLLGANAILENYGIYQMQNGSEITMVSGSVLNAYTGSDINMKTGSDLNFESGSGMSIADGAEVDFSTQAFTDTPVGGRMYGAQLMRAAAKYLANATLKWGFNIDSVSHPGNGVYVITLKNGFSDSADAIPLVTVLGGSSEIRASAAMTGAAEVTVYIDNLASGSAVAIDNDFSLVIFGGTI